MASLVDVKIEENLRYIEKMDQCIKNVMQLAQDQQKKFIGFHSKEYEKVGMAFMSLGSAFEYNQKGMFSKASLGTFSLKLNKNQYNIVLISDVKNIGTAYLSIGKLFEQQGKIDWEPLFDRMYIYKGITSNLPNVLQMQKMAEAKKRECEKDIQIQQLALTDIRRRSDVITYAVFAELEHFQQERDHNLKRALKDFLKDQVNFYKNVVSKLEDTLNQFE